MLERNVCMANATTGSVRVAGALSAHVFFNAARYFSALRFYFYYYYFFMHACSSERKRTA